MSVSAHLSWTQMYQCSIGFLLWSVRPCFKTGKAWELVHLVMEDYDIPLCQQIQNQKWLIKVFNFFSSFFKAQDQWKLLDTTGCISNDVTRYFKHWISWLNITAHWILNKTQCTESIHPKHKQEDIQFWNIVSLMLNFIFFPHFFLGGGEGVNPYWKYF